MTTHTKPPRGKIPRLPHEIREQLNQRLRDSEPGKRLVEWLNSLPEVQALVPTEFKGEPILEQNLSQYRKRSYRHWLVQQTVLEEVHRVRDNAQEIHEAAPGPFTEDLAAVVAARYALAAKRLSASGAIAGQEWTALRELCHDLVALRRGDHAAGWLHIEQEHLADERKERDQDLNELFLKWARNPEIREAICRGYISREDRLALLKQQMFGDLDELLKKGQPGHPQPPASPFESLKPSPPNQPADCPACAQPASAPSPPGRGQGEGSNNEK
ncbi:hypothetical protein SBV1_60011 [Verrucomicrobia bacterium]|nr:hypothetical protein SBV1_60011 [Verrucomicrobiota bacterium]